MKSKVGMLLALLLSALCAFGADAERIASNIAPLIDPAKLSTLGARGANPRVQRAVYWLKLGKRENVAPSKILDLALQSVGMTNELAVKLTKDALLKNLRTLEKLGCDSEEGLNEMRRGRSPTIPRGQHAGQELSVDHIIPRSVVPELDNVIANLELLPLKPNQKKSSKVTTRQLQLGEKLLKAGLLSTNGFHALSKANKH